MLQKSGPFCHELNYFYIGAVQSQRMDLMKLWSALTAISPYSLSAFVIREEQAALGVCRASTNLLCLYETIVSLNQRPEQRGQRSWHIFTSRLILAHKRCDSLRRTWFDPKSSEWADHHLPLGQKLQRIPGIPLLQLQRRGGERTSHHSLAAWEKTASPAKELCPRSAKNICAVIHYCSH